MADHGPQHYKKVYHKLLVLLVISVIGPELGIQIVTFITAFVIAVIKAWIVMKEFMHVNVEKRFIHYILATGISFMLIFYFGVAPDVSNHEGRNWENVAAKAEVERALKAAEEKPAESGEAAKP